MGRDPWHTIRTRSPIANPLNIDSMKKIITTKEVVQTKMLTEKEEGEEQKKGGKKSELTGTVAILFYWGLPSHVLLRVCKFPLSCLLLHLEPRCKRRDLTAQCHPTALPAGTQQATHHPKFIAILPMQLCVQPFLHIWPDEAMVNSFDSAGTIPKSRKRLGPIPIYIFQSISLSFFSFFKMMSEN